VGRNGVGAFRDLYNNLRKTRPEREILRGRNILNFYMTDYLQLLIDQGMRIKGVRSDGGWLEMDCAKDYELARR